MNLFRYFHSTQYTPHYEKKKREKGTCYKTTHYLLARRLRGKVSKAGKQRGTTDTGPAVLRNYRYCYIPTRKVEAASGFAPHASKRRYHSSLVRSGASRRNIEHREDQVNAFFSRLTGRSSFSGWMFSFQFTDRVALIQSNNQLFPILLNFSI